MKLPPKTNTQSVVPSNQPLLFTAGTNLSPLIPAEVTKACLDLLKEALTAVVRKETERPGDE